MNNVHHLPADRQSIIAEIAERHDTARAALQLRFASAVDALDRARAARRGIQEVIDTGREAAARLQAQHEHLVAQWLSVSPKAVRA